MQHKPRFSGILVVAVLMVLVLFFVSLSPLLASTASSHINYSESTIILKTIRSHPTAGPEHL